MKEEEEKREFRSPLAVAAQFFLAESEFAHK